MSGDNRIVGAHDAAVRATLDFVEEHLLVTREWDRSTRRHVRVNAPSMVAATFRHKANRNLEPHLHTHAVVANMTQREDGSWGSLDMGPLGPARRLIGVQYRNELAARLRKLGYALRPSMVGQVPGFEIEGYSRALIVESSTRRTEIMDLHGRNRVSQVPWRSIYSFAAFPRPRTARHASPWRRFRCCPRYHNHKGTIIENFEAQ